MSLPLLKCAECGYRGVESECEACGSNDMRECDCASQDPPCATGYVALAEFPQLANYYHYIDPNRCATCHHKPNCHRNLDPECSICRGRHPNDDRHPCE